MEQVQFTVEQQELVNKRIGEARVKARERAEADAAAKLAKDTDAATQAALMAEKKWQELAEKHQARVRELEPLEAKAKEFDELVSKMLKDEVETLGDAAKKAMDALPATMATLDKLNWLRENKGLFQVAGGGDGVGTPNRPRSKPDGDEPKRSGTKYGPVKL